MDKYKEALEDLLDYLQEYHNHYHDDVSFENRKLLKELVEKATPKLPKRNFGKGTYFKCPVCESSIGNKSKYCKHCGQRIKWEKIKWE